MQSIFATRNLDFLDGLAIVGVGLALLVVVEIEKRITRPTIEPALGTKADTRH